MRGKKKKVLQKTVKELRKKSLHDMLTKGFQKTKEGKTTPLTKDDLDNWSKMVDDVIQ